MLTPSAWESAYTFALVRNPFARQLSMFTFLLQVHALANQHTNYTMSVRIARE